MSEGYRIVPVSPDFSMVNAGGMAIDMNNGEGSFDDLKSDAVEAYRDMLEAAPKSGLEMVSRKCLQGILEFIESDDVQTVIDGANDPDPYVQEIKRVLGYDR